MERSVCWNVTTDCNEDCKFCFRFLSQNNLSFEDNKKILDTLVKINVKKITWTGGEALLFPYLFDLMKLAHDKGITNVLITNGKLLTPERIDKIKDFTDEVTFSIDSLNPEIEEIMGRGADHTENVINAMNYLKNTNIKLRLNSLVSWPNLNSFEDLARFVNKYDVERWKLFKFCSLRGKAIDYSAKFEITNEQFYNVVKEVAQYAPNTNIVPCLDANLENDYLLISPEGDFIITNDKKDVKICDYKNINLEKLEEILRNEFGF